MDGKHWPRHGLASMCITKHSVSLGWGVSGWRWRSERTLGLPCRFSITPVVRHQEAEDRFNARYCDLDTLLQEADFVCVILPLTAETRHLFGATQFARMKSSAIFINAGRGPGGR
ncbi:2-hydroxyacid dehydrogenase [Salmonella enterica subsp. enterica]|nr:2-hydroxyacid dehydrogenase [Salmonella enterica subsp. enterica]